MSSAGTVANQLCIYFGGPYDDTTHTYRTPQIIIDDRMDGPVFRRAAPKRDDHDTDYGLSAVGKPFGCLVMVLLERGEETRAALAGAVSGLKHVRWVVRMHCFLRSTSTYAEDLQDVTYELIDAIRARIEADRTCGSGGFEAGYGVGFQVAEGGEPWLRWDMSPVWTGPRELSKQYVVVEMDADQYIQA